MRTPVDFGNGIVAYFEGVPGLRKLDAGAIEKGHTGFTAPEFEIAVTEHGFSDGGTIGTSRTLARRLHATISHDRVWTRAEIQRAFTTGIERIITTDLGSMPYVVEALTFPESLFEAARRFSIALVSPLAYPRAAARFAASEVDETSGLEYTAEYPIAYDDILAVELMTLVSASDVRCPALVTITCSQSASELTFSINDRPTRLLGDLDAGDVIVVDNVGAAPIVTVNGVNALSMFDRDGEFPYLDPGTNRVTLSTAAILSINWSPLVVGLL